MSAVASVPGGGLVAAAKGAPETMRGMLGCVPEGYDETYKWFTRRGSRVLALGVKRMEAMSGEKVSVVRCAGVGMCADGGLVRRL